MIRDATTLWELVERRAAESGDRLMLVDPSDRRITFGQFRDRAQRVAAGLQDLGVREDTPVTWQLPSTIDAVVASMALARLGALQNPVLHLYREKEMGFALRQTGSQFVIVPGEGKAFDYRSMVEALVKEVDRPPQILAVDALPEGEPASLPPAPTATRGADGDGAPVRWIYYTSGTTSDPKGVRHTDGTLLAGGIGLAVALDMSPDDVGSIAFPFAHIAGPDYLVTMLASGFPAVIVEAFVPADVIPVYRRNGVTMAGGSTAFYQMFLVEQRKQPGEKIIPTLRLLSGGGAAKPPEIYHEVLAEIGVKTCHGYGMTEVPMISQGSPHDSDDQLVHSEGRPVFGADVRIVDGEVRVKGPMVCKGYTDPALTEEAFDEDGYFRTGDLGHLRDDGHLVLTGRLKDIIIRKGENISAKEIEDVLYQHPKVGDVAVVGLPDRERGERVCAVVERAEGQDDLAFDEMVEHLEAAGLMTQKLPEQLEVVDALPRNETLRKVLKYKLREQYG